MKRIAPIVSVLFLAACSTTAPQSASQKQADVLARAEAKCSQVAVPEKNIACLNHVVHQDSYWGQGVMVVATKDGTPRLVDKVQSPDNQYNVGGDTYNSGSAR